MKLREYAFNAIKRLSGLRGEAFAKAFVAMRMECSRLYHGGLITSTAHGIEFFENVLAYIDTPNSWLKQFSEKSVYEKNFVLILELNR